MNNRFWTPEEDAIIREHYPTGGTAACLRHLPDRSMNAVRRRASALNIGYQAKDRTRPELQRKHLPEIDAQIIAFYQAPQWGGLKELKRRTGKSVGYLKHRAAELGVAVIRHKPPEWTEAEEDRLMELAALHPGVVRRKLIAEGFPPRSITGIVVHQKRLGLRVVRARQDVGWYTATQVGKLVGKDRKCIIGWIERGWVRAERANTLRVDDFWMIHEQDLKKMLLDHAERLELHRWDRRFLVQVLGDPAPKLSIRQVMNPEPRKEAA